MKIKCRDENLHYMIGLMPVWLIIQKYGSEIEENSGNYFKCITNTIRNKSKKQKIGINNKYRIRHEIKIKENKSDKYCWWIDT